ncbi:MAG: photosynthetic reaction center subunit H [Hyphomonadaceae bacterium]|nr:photosynthetic reaction center subunit H [Hyphomonadaceae bacterium]
MYNAFFAGQFDVMELTLYAFFLFFFGLVLYLRREDRREGYPLEDEASGRHEPTPGFLWYAKPKTFVLPHGRGELSKPNAIRDDRELSARRSAVWSGAPLEPVGNPLKAGVGPGSYAQRADKPDLMHGGEPRIAPLRIATTYSIAKEDPDPRGMTVVGADNGAVGVVSDIWVDRMEFMIRYLEIAVNGADGAPSAKRILAPMTMAVVNKGKRTVRIEALLAAQFADAPTPASPEQITLLEEEKIVAYFGAGYLYATPARSEPLL